MSVLSSATGACRLLIFDFDGTLADSFPWFLEHVNRLAARFGFTPIAAERINEYRGLGSRELLARLALSRWRLPRVAAEMRTAMAADIERIALFDGALDTLRALRARGLAIAVVSSNSRANVERVLGAEGVALVDHFACGAALFGKRALFARVARAAGVPAAAVLCVGDEQRDIEAARALGMPALGVAWGFAAPEALAACSGRPPLQGFSDLLAWIDRG